MPYTNPAVPLRYREMTELPVFDTQITPVKRSFLGWLKLVGLFVVAIAGALVMAYSLAMSAYTNAPVITFHHHAASAAHHSNSSAGCSILKIIGKPC